MRYNRKLVALLFIVLLLTFILFSSYGGSGYFPRRTSSYRLAYDHVVLKQSPNDVPVIVVDQHQEGIYILVTQPLNR